LVKHERAVRYRQLAQQRLGLRRNGDARNARRRSLGIVLRAYGQKNPSALGL
jgi:hypothetical protein